MLQTDAVVSLLLGGLGALLGLGLSALHARRSAASHTSPVRHALVAGLVAGLALPVGQAFDADRGIRAALRLTPVWREVLEDELAPVVAHPRLVQDARGMDLLAVQRYVTRLTRAGLRRLSDEELRSWARLKLRLAESSPEVCADMWLGEPPLEGMASALERLSHAEQRRWASLTARAAWLELERAEPPVSGPLVSLEFGLQTILERSPAPTAGLLRDHLQRGELRRSRACTALKVVFEGVEGLEPGLRESVLRALVAS